MTNKNFSNTSSTTVTNNSTDDEYYTAYIVRETNSRRFLTRRAYSGRVKGIWGRQSNAELFYFRSEAQSCASNINFRRPEGYSAYQAEVVPVEVKKLSRRR